MCTLPVDLGGTFVDVAYGQLKPHDASNRLIQAVRNADTQIIRDELLKIKDRQQLLRLLTIIQRIGPVLGSQR
jgi:hypothetical protein